MIAPTMSYSVLISQYLEPNGFRIEKPQPQDFWNKHNRIYVCKDEYKFPLQYQSTYKYLQLYHLFTDIGIQVPQDISDYYSYQKSIHELQKGILGESSEQKPDAEEESSKD